MGGTSTTPAPTQTTVQKTEIPAAQRQALEFGLSEARQQYEDPRQYYQGSTVVGFDPATEQALSLLQTRGMQSTPITQSSEEALQRQLQPLDEGQFTDLVNAQLRQRIPQVQSQFARAGTARGGLAQQAIGREVAQATTQALAQDRARQLQALGMAPTISNLRLNEIQGLSGVGATREELAGRQLAEDIARQRFEEEERRNALNEYLSRVQGVNLGQTTTSTQTGSPLTRNRSAGILGGGLAGAQVGSQYGLPGALIGGGIGALTGLF